ncbi:MAG: hypothetical protein WA931_18205 [Rhodococcus sp. (in: high G+C Gram-positive bacteria)]
MSENVLDRYQTYRIRRYLKHQAQYADSLPSWRSQSRRRTLVVVLTVSLVYLAAASVFTIVGPDWAPITWVPGALVMIGTWSMIQRVVGRKNDAPADALDEWDLERRNNARSIGFTVTQALVMTAAFVLVFGANFIDADQLSLGGGYLVIVALIAGICTPGIILAWTSPDPDPEDIATPTTTEPTTTIAPGEGHP